MQWSWLPGYEQRWNLIKMTDDPAGPDWDEYIITNAHSGDCLAIPGGSFNSGVGAIQWTCATNSRDGHLGVDDQRWRGRYDRSLVATRL
ncbi:RICIN domain-containing protein [Kribbella sp. NPDC003505]|uniref:RICIN domain-containing protein n=1 Tax=Kribbella sp. NPDC003505 TaxID=3154448 RepID=UPI0033BEC7C5